MPRALKSFDIMPSTGFTIIRHSPGSEHTVTMEFARVCTANHLALVWRAMKKSKTANKANRKIVGLR